MVQHAMQSPLALAMAGAIFGLIQALLGYRLFKLTLVVLGFAGAAWAVPAALGGRVDSDLARGLIALLAGCGGAVLLPALYLFSVFLVGAFFGGTVGLTFGSLLSPLVGAVLAAVLALIAGWLALKAQRLMIVLATAFGGSWLAVVSFAGWRTGAGFEGFDGASTPWSLPALAVWLVLSAIGTVVQLRSGDAPPADEPPAKR